MGKALSAPATRPVHTIARIRGAGGGTIAVGVDCDGVTLGGVILDHGGREDFSRAYFEAVRLADEWAAQHSGAGDD